MVFLSNVKALAQLVKWNDARPLSRFESRLPLAEILMKAGSIRHDAIGEKLAELGRSFAHDVLNLAALAGRLLWLEGVTPDRWRSYDLVTVSVDTEAYFVMLQTACDIMAAVISLLAAKKNQAPSDSFHRLNEWAKSNATRLLVPFRIVAKNLPWFNEINGVRTKLVHRGASVWIYTDRARFQWGIHSGERRKKSTSARKRPSNAYLLPDIARLTQATLGFSDKLALAVKTSGITHGSSGDFVLSGVSVPALTHLLTTYKRPILSDSLLYNARSLLLAGSYVPAAYFGYPSEYWWHMLIRMCEYFGRAPEFLFIPIQVDGRVENCQLVFTDGAERYAVLAFDHFATDEYGNNDDWVRDVVRSVADLQVAQELRHFIIVARTGKQIDFLPETQIPVIVEQDPRTAARRVFMSVRQPEGMIQRDDL